MPFEPRKSGMEGVKVKNIKKIALFSATVLAAGQMSIVAMAHGGHGYNNVSTPYCLCNEAGCSITEIHQHDGVYYYGHSLNDGHDYHMLCDIEGCSLTDVHCHDDVCYFGHFYGDGHDYHVSCGVDGCTNLSEHAHEYHFSKEHGHHH